MPKEKRPYQDETIFNPLYRKMYSRIALGRPGDPKEEPIKHTQTLAEKIHFEAQAEWIARLYEYSCGCDKFVKGELAAEEEAMKKVDELMGDFGVEEMTKGIEKGELEAMEGVEQAMGLAEDMTGLEAMDEILTEEMYTGYGMYPPVVVLPLRLGPAVSVLLYGQSVDTCWTCLDQFTMENMWAVDWHFEDGLQTANNWWYLDDDWKPIMERRHLRTGEKFKYLCVQRPLAEGGFMVMDIMKDLRNERTPEYANSAMYYHGYVDNVSIQAQYPSRSELEIVGLINVYFSPRVGFPYHSYNYFCPIPGLFAMFDQLPLELILPRFLSMFVGVDFWLTNYTLTHLQTLNELFGEEMIPAAPEDSMGSYFRYGMDVFRYPPSFKQAKYAYGEEAQMREPTQYPLPQKKICGIGEAAEIIEKARKEHPEWLAEGVKPVEVMK